MTNKAHYYHEQLENARCDGNWLAVPELARKVRKHTPSRACLALAAETECAVSSMTTAGIRPSAASAARNLDVTKTVPQLRAAIDEEHANAEDRFQAQVCVGWLHWVVGSYDLALQRLPKSMEDTGLGDPVNLMGEWTCVCALKSAYLRANCSMREGKTVEALAALKAAMPVMKRIESGRSVKKQLRYWSELFLTEYCMLSSAAIEKGDVSLEDPLTLAPLRSWATYWDVMGAPVTGGFGFRGSVPRRQIWCEYYVALSHTLQNGLNYEGGHVKGIPAEYPARSHLRAELKFAEGAYRSLLLAETSFPRANEEREEIEAFVRRVIENWSLLCGRGWSEEHLGQGGRVAISRGVLELLYSSATRTYHSTAILRSLFLVHLSLAEFDLAFKAFDSYLEIIKKGKARVDKTGEVEPSLDGDGTVLETMAQAIMVLCRYGNRKAGEKAHDLAAELEDWLSRLPPVKGPENGTPVILEDEEGNEAQASIAPHVVASAWQAIGLSHAHWSRLTSEAGSRVEIQAKAIRCFRKSLIAEFGRCKDIRSFFGLALLLAERRELTAAIELTRSALLSCKSAGPSDGLFCGPYWQERTLIPLWHLLALLLSARQDYAMAFRACEGALEQFKDSCILFGRADAPTFRSEHLNGTGTPSTYEGRRGLVDDMDDAEKEALLEIKTTQLTLIELTEGSNVAVNASYELLVLFTRLFGNVSTQEMAIAPKASQSPRTSGTLRGIRGSIFGTKVDRSSAPSVPTVPAVRQPAASTIDEKMFVMTSRPSTANSVAIPKPAIQVISESEGQLEAGRSRRASSSHGPRGESRRRNSLKRRNRSGSRPRPSTAGALSQATVVDGDAFFTPAQEPDQLGAFSFPVKQAQPQTSPQSRGKASSYLSIAGKGGDRSELPGEMTHAPPHLLPLIQFPKEKERAQRTMILIRIWLTIARFYRRTKMAEDCKGAIAEAQKLVQGLEEAESKREQTEGGGWQCSGWAEKRSVDDCWGDVWTELGLLALAQGEPYTGRSDFEQALAYCPDHPAATVNLCNILLDVYCERLLPNPVVAPLDLSDLLFGEYSQARAARSDDSAVQGLGRRPLGLGPAVDETASAPRNGLDGSRRGDVDGEDGADKNMDDKEQQERLPAAYMAVHLPLVDRLAARDRAHGLLTRLTRLGSSWQRADAWFVLARAYEESGQADKAREALWWCVELEEASAVRDWHCLGGGGGGYLI